MCRCATNGTPPARRRTWPRRRRKFLPRLCRSCSFREPLSYLPLEELEVLLPVPLRRPEDDRRVALDAGRDVARPLQDVLPELLPGARYRPLLRVVPVERVVGRVGDVGEA